MKETFTIILMFLFTLLKIKSQEIENPQNLETLLETIPSIFDKLTSSFYLSQCSYSSKLTYSYFRKIESLTKIKYYLSQKESDFPQIIDNILITLNISGKNYKNIYKYLDNFLSSLKDEEYYTDLDWMNQIIASVTTDEKKAVSYGNLFAIKKGNKIDIILCYAETELVSVPFSSGYLDYSEYNKINNGLFEESYVNYANSVELFDRGDRNFMIYLRLAGIKAFANKHYIDVPYPRFSGYI